MLSREDFQVDEAKTAMPQPEHMLSCNKKKKKKIQIKLLNNIVFLKCSPLKISDIFTLPIIC